jgi:osmotically-inducible protein OsmY
MRFATCGNSAERNAECQPAAIAKQVLAAAEARLRESLDLAEHRVRCEFEGGILTLRGCVPTYWIRQAAQGLVRSIHGVRKVENRLDVMPLPASEPPSGW